MPRPCAHSSSRPGLDEKSVTVVLRLEHPSATVRPLVDRAGEHRDRRHTNRVERPLLTPASSYGFSIPTTAGSLTATNASHLTLRQPADATMPQALVWAACPYPGVPPALQCATLTVPVDYAHLGRGSTHVVIDRLPAADPAHRLGSLVADPGGPGSAGTELVGAEARGGSPSLFTSGVRDDYDLIGFDPRGVGVGRADAELPRSLLRHRDRGDLRRAVSASGRANGAGRQPRALTGRAHDGAR
jgi:hypothetical protein